VKLPDSCKCADKDLGAVLTCDLKVDLEFAHVSVLSDTVHAEIDFEPCGDPMDFGVHLSDKKYGTLYDLEAKGDATEHVPIPDLAVTLGAYEAGVYADVTIGGNLAALTMNIGLDVCAEVEGVSGCGSGVSIPGFTNPFPVMIIQDATFQFDDVCPPKKKSSSDGFWTPLHIGLVAGCSTLGALIIIGTTILLLRRRRRAMPGSATEPLNDGVKTSTTSSPFFGWTRRNREREEQDAIVKPLRG
jgi:hypothetical protein